MPMQTVRTFPSSTPASEKMLLSGRALKLGRLFSRIQKQIDISSGGNSLAVD